MDWKSRAGFDFAGEGITMVTALDFRTSAIQLLEFDKHPNGLSHIVWLLPATFNVLKFIIEPRSSSQEPQSSLKPSSGEQEKNVLFQEKAM